MTHKEALALRFGSRPRIRRGARALFSRKPTWYLDCPRCGFVYRIDSSSLKDAIKSGQHNGICPDCLTTLLK